MKIDPLTFISFQPTLQQWKYVFLIAAGISSICGILHVIFSESNLQVWNTPRNVYVVRNIEMIDRSQVPISEQQNARESDNEFEIKF